MSGLAMQMYIKMLQAKQAFLEEERGAVDIVAIVVLIGIAVVLALFFKEQIGNLLNQLFTDIGQSASDVTKPVTIS